MSECPDCGQLVPLDDRSGTYLPHYVDGRTEADVRVPILLGDVGVCEGTYLTAVDPGGSSIQGRASGLPGLGKRR